MKQSISIAFMLLLYISSFCQDSGMDAGYYTEGPPVANEKSTDPEAVKAYIDKVNKEVNELIKAGKYEEAGKFFAPDVIQMIAGQPPITSRAAWIETQRGAAQIGDWDLQIKALEVEVRDDIAVERGYGIQTFTANDNSPMPSFQVRGDYLVMWKKMNGQWMIQWDYVVLQMPEGQ